MKNTIKNNFNFFIATAMLAITFTANPKALADKLTVYVYPSPTGINWASPNSLAWSTIASMMVSDKELEHVHAIGHMNFDLKCEASSELPTGARIVTGQTSQSSSQEMNEIFRQGYGLDVFLTPVPGRWESQAEIEADLPVRMERGSVAFIDFTINPKACARVVKFLKEYKRRGLNKIYGGLQDRPRHNEGAGCSAFVEGVLEVAGLMDPVWQSYFQHHVFVPNELLGGPTTGRRVSFIDLIFGIDSLSWNSSARNAYSLSFWDPFYVYYWIQQAARRPLLLKNFKYTPTRNQNAPGILIDARRAPTPNDNFWL